MAVTPLSPRTAGRGLPPLGPCPAPQARPAALAAPRRARLPPLGAVHRHEARAESLDTGEVLVACGLVDGALGAELRLQRHHGDAVGFPTLIAGAPAGGTGA